MQPIHFKAPCNAGYAPKLPPSHDPVKSTKPIPTTDSLFPLPPRRLTGPNPRGADDKFGHAAVGTLRAGFSVAQGHALELVHEATPVVGQHLGVLDPLGGPVLAPAADAVLRRLEGDELVPETLAHEDGSVVLLDDRLLVLVVGGGLSQCWCPWGKR